MIAEPRRGTVQGLPPARSTAAFRGAPAPVRDRGARSVAPRLRRQLGRVIIAAVPQADAARTLPKELPA
jgi:hypothetical protein